MHQCATVPFGVNLMNNEVAKLDDSAEETEVQSDDDDDLTSSDGSYVKVFVKLVHMTLRHGLYEYKSKEY